MTQNIRLFCFVLCCLMVWAGAASAVENQADAADRSAIISFETLDGGVEQINLDQVWRIRASLTSDEPAGVTVIDYAFERLFVRDRLDTVIEKLRTQRNLKQFTLPSGDPVYIVPEKIVGIQRALRNQHHQNSKSILIAREGGQQVQESRETVREMLGQ